MAEDREKVEDHVEERAKGNAFKREIKVRVEVKNQTSLRRNGEREEINRIPKKVVGMVVVGTTRR